MRRLPDAILPFLAIAALSLPLAGCSERDVAVKPSPIGIESETIGYGRSAEPGDIVTVDYRVLLPSGQELMADKDFQFELGSGAVVEGMDDAVRGMKVGGRRTVKCPPHKHWGSIGYGERQSIPPNTILTFSVRLRSVD